MMLNCIQYMKQYYFSKSVKTSDRTPKLSSSPLPPLGTLLNIFPRKTVPKNQLRDVFGAARNRNNASSSPPQPRFGQHVIKTRRKEKTMYRTRVRRAFHDRRPSEILARTRVTYTGEIFRHGHKPRTLSIIAVG